MESQGLRLSGADFHRLFPVVGVHGIPAGGFLLRHHNRSHDAGDVDFAVSVCEILPAGGFLPVGGVHRPSVCVQHLELRAGNRGFRQAVQNAEDKATGPLNLEYQFQRLTGLDLSGLGGAFQHEAVRDTDFPHVDRQAGFQVLDGEGSRRVCGELTAAVEGCAGAIHSPERDAFQRFAVRAVNNCPHHKTALRTVVEVHGTAAGRCAGRAGAASGRRTGTASARNCRPR